MAKRTDNAPRFSNRCPNCRRAHGACPECSKSYKHGTADACTADACKKLNAPIDCACGMIVAKGAGGILTPDGELRPWIVTREGTRIERFGRCQCGGPSEGQTGPLRVRPADLVHRGGADWQCPRCHGFFLFTTEELTRELDEAMQEAAHLLTEIAEDDEIMVRFKSAKTTWEHPMAGRIRETVKRWKAVGETFLANLVADARGGS